MSLTEYIHEIVWIELKNLASVDSITATEIEAEWSWNALYSTMAAGAQALK